MRSLVVVLVLLAIALAFALGAFQVIHLGPQHRGSDGKPPVVEDATPLTAEKWLGFRGRSETFNLEVFSDGRVEVSHYTWHRAQGAGEERIYKGSLDRAYLTLIDERGEPKTWLDDFERPRRWEFWHEEERALLIIDRGEVVRLGRAP